MEAARQMLNTIFDACNYERNTVPVEVLSSYGNYRKERYLLQKAVLIICMVLFLLLPLLFLAPTVTMEQETVGNGVKVTLQVKSIIPVRRVTAEMNDRNLPVYQRDDDIYVVQPDDNGTLTVTTTLWNRQMTAVSCEVEGIDLEAPVLTASMLDGDDIVLTITDEGSGVNPKTIRLQDSDGLSLTGFTWENENNLFRMPYPEKAVTLMVADYNGNTLRVVLTPQ